MNNITNLHYGSGPFAAPGWYNCDASPTLRLQKLPVLGAFFRKSLRPGFPKEVHYGDIVRGLRVGQDSCAAIFCSHVLEHLSYEDLRVALRNTYKYLRPGGTFRLIVPDFEQQIDSYLKSSDVGAVSEFMSYTSFGRKTRPRGAIGFLKEYFGNSYHLWAWDFKGLAHEVDLAGFQKVRRCYYGDSTDESFKAVENPARYQWAMGIECSK